MKILHLIYTNAMAGAEKYLTHLLEPLGEKGFECHILMVCGPDAASSLEPFMETMKEKGIPSKMFVTRRKYFIQTASKINNYLKENNISVIHSHLLNSDVLATLVKLFFNRNIIIISTKHGYTEKILKLIPGTPNLDSLAKIARRSIYYYVSKFVVQQSDFNYAVSHTIGRLYYALGLTKTEMPFIHHGVPVSSTNENPSQFRLADPQLIIVARIEEVKGHEFLLKALPAVVQKFPDSKLLILGEGSELETMKSLTIKLGIDPNVEFLGFRQDPYSYVRHSDIMVLPSLFEAFGLVYIEAFALGKPVIAFDTAAGNEIIENNVTGILVAAKDVNALSEKIIYLLETPAEARRIAEAASKKYHECFSTEKMVENTSAFYRKVLSEKMKTS